MRLMDSGSAPSIASAAQDSSTAPSAEAPTLKEPVAERAPAQTPEQHVDSAAKAYDQAQKAYQQALQAPSGSAERADIDDARAALSSTRQTLDAAVRAEIGGKVSLANAQIPPSLRMPEGTQINGYGKAILLRLPKDSDARSAVQSAIDGYRAQRTSDTAVSNAGVAGDQATQKLAALAKQLKGQPQAVLDDAAANPQVQQWTREAAGAIDKAYKGNGGRDAVDAAQLLAETVNTLQLPPELAAQVVRSLSPDTLNGIADPSSLAGSGTVLANLSKVYDALGDTPEAAALVDQIASSNSPFLVDGDAIRLQSGVGEVSTEFATALAGALKSQGQDGLAQNVAQGALEGAKAYYKDTVQQDLKNYQDTLSDLAWLKENGGSIMTPAQQQKAIQDYLKAHPDFQSKVDAAQAKLVKDGERLQGMLGALDGLPSDLKQSIPGFQSGLDDMVKQKDYQQITDLVAGKDPEFFEGEKGEAALQLLSENVEKGNVSKETAGHVFQQYLTAKLGGFGSFNPADPASRAAVITRLNQLGDSRWAGVLGVSPEGLQKATQAVIDTVPKAGQSEAEIGKNLETMKTSLDKLGLSEDTVAGRLFRLSGVAAASVSLANSVSNLSNPDLKQYQKDLSLLSSSAGLTAYGIDLGKSLSLVDPGGLVGGALARNTLSVLAAASDFVESGVKLSQGDPVSSVLDGLRGLSTVALFASDTPVIGWIAGAVWISTTLGLGQYEKVQESNKHMNDDTIRFLQDAGLSPETAHVLYDQSSNGYSVVPLLAQYAKDKGYDLSDPAQQQAFTGWLNGLSTHALTNVRDLLNMTNDQFGGNATKLSNDRTEYEPTRVDGGGNLLDAAPTSVGQIDAEIKREGGMPLAQR